MLTIGQMGSKILSFLLVPLYTRVLSTDEYGTYDFLNTTLGVLIPLFTIMIFDAMFRYAFENQDKTGLYLKSALSVYYAGFVFFVIVIILNKIFSFIPILSEYSWAVIMMYLATTSYTIFTKLARSCEMMKEIATAGILSTFTMCSLNILLLLVVKLSLTGYMLSYIGGQILPAIYLAYKTNFIQLTEQKHTRVELKTERRKLVAFSVPLIFANIGWWINSLSDRYVVTYFCGISANGVYSVAYKIPTILAMVQSIIADAWNISAIKESGDEERNAFYISVYRKYCCIFVIACSVIMFFTRPLAAFLYANDFYQAWIYVPWLLISTVFSALSAFLGGILTAGKDVVGLTVPVVISAVINTAFNFILVPGFGAIGAAYATAIGYFVAWFLRIKSIKNRQAIELLSNREFIAYFALLLQAIMITAFTNPFIVYGSGVLLMLCLIAAFRKEIKSFGSLFILFMGKFKKAK